MYFIVSDKIPVLIEIAPFCSEFMCAFECSAIPHAEQACEVTMETLPSNSQSSDLDLTYSLTPNTLEYIKSDCPLVATLVSLMCSDNIDETLDDAFDDSHFEASGSLSSLESSLQVNLKRSRAASSMSALDIRSYRYEKLTNEYPALKRHVLNYIVPMAATEDPDIEKGSDPILKLLTSDIVERFKGNMLSLHESKNFRALITEIIGVQFEKRKWMEIVKVIDSVPVTLERKQAALCSLHDFVVCCAINDICSKGESTKMLKKEDSQLVSSLVHRLVSPECQARQLLCVHRRLQIEHNLDLFDMVLSQPHDCASQKDVLEMVSKRLKVYYRVCILEDKRTYQLFVQLPNFTGYMYMCIIIFMFKAHITSY